MIKTNSEKWTTDENIDLDIITSESDGKTLNIGVSWDKTFDTVTVMYNELDDKEVLTAAKLKDFKTVNTIVFTTTEEARDYFNDTRNPFKAVHLVKAHQRKEQN